MLTDHGRYSYSPITKRTDYNWPGGKRLAVYIGLNLEHFAFGEGLGAELAPVGRNPMYSITRGAIMVIVSALGGCWI